MATGTGAEGFPRSFEATLAPSERPSAPPVYFSAEAPGVTLEECCEGGLL